MTKRLLKILFFIFICEFGAANEITLPKPTGPYAVGINSMELASDSRMALRDYQPRRWMVQTFYPCAPHQGTYPYMPETLVDGKLGGIRTLAYAKPAAAILKNKTFPVIIFVPGLGHNRQDYTILCEDLASHGYVTLSLDQPYVSTFVRFKDGTIIVPTLKDAWKVSRDRNYRYIYYNEAMKEAMDDITFMLDSFDIINERYCEGQLNPNAIILMGHSFGGNVAHTLGFTDNRIKAIVDIDSKITDRAIYGRIGVPPNLKEKPVLFIRGMMQYQPEDIGDQLSNVKNAQIWAPNVQHSAFSDKVFFTHKAPSSTSHGLLPKFWAWLFKTGPVFDGIDTDLDGQDIEEWIKIYRAHIVLWLDKLFQERKS